METGSLPSLKSKRSWTHGLAWQIPGARKAENCLFDTELEVSEAELAQRKAELSYVTDSEAEDPELERRIEAYGRSEGVSGTSSTGGTEEAASGAPPEATLLALENLEKAAAAAFVAEIHLKACVGLSGLKTQTIIEALEVAETSANRLALVAHKMRYGFDHAGKRSWTMAAENDATQHAIFHAMFDASGNCQVGWATAGRLSGQASKGLPLNLCEHDEKGLPVNLGFRARFDELPTSLKWVPADTEEISSRMSNSCQKKQRRFLCPGLDQHDTGFQQ